MWQGVDSDWECDTLTGLPGAHLLLLQESWVGRVGGVGAREERRRLRARLWLRRMAGAISRAGSAVNQPSGGRQDAPWTQVLHQRSFQYSNDMHRGVISCYETPCSHV